MRVSWVAFCAAMVVARSAFAQETAPDAPAPPEEKKEPYAFADFTWLNGTSRQTEFPLDGKVFSGQFMTDANYTYDFAHPKDHTLVGSTTSGRTSEFQLSHVGIGGDFHYDNVRGRFMTQLGLYEAMQPRNDASTSRGQWNLADAYKYITEAYGGYHINALNGINLDAGIFMSYVGLCSYYDYENWVYQESFVSANTPWFFNGIRLQIYTSEKLKIEPWLINGWQSYGMFNEQPGIGLQVLWRPNGSISVLSNSYFGAEFSTIRVAFASTAMTASRSNTSIKRAAAGSRRAHSRSRSTRAARTAAA